MFNAYANVRLNKVPQTPEAKSKTGKWRKKDLIFWVDADKRIFV